MIVVYGVFIAISLLVPTDIYRRFVVVMGWFTFFVCYLLRISGNVRLLFFIFHCGRRWLEVSLCCFWGALHWYFRGRFLGPCWWLSYALVLE